MSPLAMDSIQQRSSAVASRSYGHGHAGAVMRTRSWHAVMARWSKGLVMGHIKERYVAKKMPGSGVTW